MISVASGVPASAFGAAFTLLDIAKNPDAYKATLEELQKVHADASAMVDKASTLDESNKKALADLTVQTKALADSVAAHAQDVAILAEAKTAHEKAVTEHLATSTAATKAQLAKDADLAKRKAALDTREAEISKRENRIGGREKAADAKFAQGEAVINHAKSLGLHPIGA